MAKAGGIVQLPQMYRMAVDGSPEIFIPKGRVIVNNERYSIHSIEYTGQENGFYVWVVQGIDLIAREDRVAIWNMKENNPPSMEEICKCFDGEYRFVIEPDRSSDNTFARLGTWAMDSNGQIKLISDDDEQPDQT